MPNDKPAQAPKITGNGPFGQAGVNPSGTVKRSDDLQIKAPRSESLNDERPRHDRSKTVTKK